MAKQKISQFCRLLTRLTFWLRTTTWEDWLEDLTSTWLISKGHFWNFGVVFPKQMLTTKFFAACENGELSLSRTIPIQIHGDEGHGFKRQGIMMLSIQGAIGRGQKPFLKKHVLPTARNKRMGLNIGGSSFNSRFLFASMPKKWYNTNPVFWRSIFFWTCWIFHYLFPPRNFKQCFPHGFIAEQASGKLPRFAGAPDWKPVGTPAWLRVQQWQVAFGLHRG